MRVVKKDNSIEKFDIEKILTSVGYAYRAVGKTMPVTLNKLLRAMYESPTKSLTSTDEIQKSVADILMRFDPDAAFKYIAYNEHKKHKGGDKWFRVDEQVIRELIKEKVLINSYLKSTGKTRENLVEALGFNEDSLNLEIDIHLSKFIID